MILSVSRRTDIPAFYAEWFINRMREGYVLVRNPMNYHQVSKVSLEPKVIDCIVFWTKNAAPLLPYIDEISSKYDFYFQYTLNAYDHTVEQNTPVLSERLKTFKALSSKIGAEHIIWRYDPVLLAEHIDINWHKTQFDLIARQLDGYTKACIFSYIDLYEKVKSNVSGLGIRTCTTNEMEELASTFSTITSTYNMTLQTCAETIDLSRYGIVHSHCVDGNLIEKITGRKLNAKKDQNQREACGCLESIDIGQYNTCRHGCKYCYANFSPQSVITLSSKHDLKSPFLIGNQEPEDKITERKMKSLLGEAAGQISMF